MVERCIQLWFARQSISRDINTSRVDIEAAPQLRALRTTGFGTRLELHYLPIMVA